MGASGNPAVRSAQERLQAEARSAMEELDGITSTVTLHGKNGDALIVVPSYLDWDDDALSLLREGDMRGWAAGALDEDNFEAWRTIRPTNRQAAQFFDDWQDATGEDLGESEAS